MATNIWVTIYKYSWIAVGTMVLGLIGYAFYPPFHQYNTLKTKQLAVLEQIRVEEEQLRILRQKQGKLINDPHYVERIAREELGYAKPGETVYKFTPGDASNATARP